MTRRGLLKWLAGLGLVGAATAAYGVIVEPGFMLEVRYYKLTPPHWPAGLKLRMTAIADPHVAEPYMPLTRWRKIIETANALAPDVHLLLGDYAVGHNFVRAHISAPDMAAVAGLLRAPLGAVAIMGNHDWRADPVAHKRMTQPTAGQTALEAQGITVLENRAVRLIKNGQPFWISGTSSMVAFGDHKIGRWGLNDLPATLAQVTDDAPIIHLAHEPDLFVDMPDRVSLTLSGHTHGGQVRILGYSPIVPSSFGNRFAYGHVVEDGRHLIVSGGLGVGALPVRLGMRPELLVIELG